MTRRLLVLAGYAVVVVALVLGITALSPAALPRVTRVVPPQENRSVCQPGATGAGTWFAADATRIAVLGGSAEPASGPVVRSGQEQPLILTGEGRPTGGFLNADAAARTWTPCQPAQTRGLVLLPGVAGAELLITNPDASGAVVDLTILAADGEIEALGARGIAVAANSTRRIALSVMVDVAGPVAVSYRATRGRASVAARTRIDAVLDSTIALTPATALTFAGVAAGVADATVLLANPSDARASVDVTVHGATAAFTPDGGGAVQVPPRSVVAVQLGAALAGEAAALGVASDSPIGAAVVAGAGAGRVTLPLVAAGHELAALLPGGGVLQLTAAAGDAAATVTRVVGGAGQTVTVTVPAGATVTLPPGGAGTEPETIRVTADADVLGAVVFAGAAGAMAVPLSPAGGPTAEPLAAEVDPLLH